mmetsp:Transcript_42396/g.134720  ORF Transcript_42396/g.134720 Transcript_42396/m.134720 type:complete len:471 (-) Transcript_42396:112-1524(-)
MAPVADITLKVIDGDKVERHQLSVRSFNELDDWLLGHVGAPYVLLEADTQQPFTAARLRAVLAEGSHGPDGLVLHVRVQRSSGVAPPPPVLEELPGPPAQVRVAIRDGQPVVHWEPPRHFNSKKVLSYELLASGGMVSLPAVSTSYAIQGSLEDVTSKVSVRAVAKGGPGEWASAMYVLPAPLAATDLKSLTAILWEGCWEFWAARQRNWVRLLLVGKQHHGKSSLLNHMVRCIKYQMDIGDEVETGPPSEMETTLDVKKIVVALCDFNFTLLDAPAFSVLDQVRRKQLQELLECAEHGWRRGDATAAGLFPLLNNSPDAVVVVVSLQSWRDEHDELKEYLQGLQGILKHATRNDVAFPFVVAATHTDAFMEEAGNAGQDPKHALDMAIRDLSALANTTKVYAITNYTDASTWTKRNMDATYRMLRDVTKLAKNAQTDKVHVSSNETLQIGIVVAVCFVFVAVIAAVSSK